MPEPRETHAAIDARRNAQRGGVRSVPETDDRLLWLLRRAADEWGPRGVALTALRLWPDAVSEFDLKPEEPQGLGAVVQDREGARWVRASVIYGGANWTRCNSFPEGHAWRGFADIDVAKVISGGAAALAPSDPATDTGGEGT